MTKSVSVYTVHEAKTHLSRILRMVESGAEVEIRRGAVPVARLVPIEEPSKPTRQLGTLKGQIWISDDFDETDQDIVDAFENSEIFPADQ